MEDDDTVLIRPFRYGDVLQSRGEQCFSTALLNYMTSRLRAALCKWESSSSSESDAWWLEGLRNEVNAAMIIVGHAAARSQFLDIPPLLCGVALAFGDDNDFFKFRFSRKMFEEVHRLADPEDPTEVVDEYYHDWWNRFLHWQTEPHVMVDKHAAFQFHCERFGKIRAPYPTVPNPGPSPPNETLASNPCTSPVCEQRLHAVLEELKKAAAVARSWQTNMENDRVAAARHIQHLKVLKKYMLDNNKSSLTLTDADNLLYEAGGEGAVLEVPSDFEIGIGEHKNKKKSNNRSEKRNLGWRKKVNNGSGNAKGSIGHSGNSKRSAGPSAGTGKGSVGPSAGPSTNRSLTPESLSSGGFDSDSASNFIPSS